MPQLKFYLNTIKTYIFKSLGELKVSQKIVNMEPPVPSHKHKIYHNLIKITKRAKPYITILSAIICMLLIGADVSPGIFVMLSLLVNFSFKNKAR